MKKDDTQPVSIHRQRAEELLKRKALETESPLTEMETRELIHELEVHKLELELQNEELRHAWAVAEVASDRYTELYDFAPSGYVTLTREGKIVEINLQGSLMLGRERLRLKNTGIDYFISDQTKPAFSTFLGKIFEGKSTVTCDVSFTHGDRAEARIHLAGIVSENGENCVVTMVDITERIRMDAALRDSEEKYRRFFEHTSFGIFQSTPEGKAVAVNPAFAEMFGYESVEDALNTIQDISTDVFVDPNRRSEIIRLMKENPDLKTFENLYRRKDGSSFIGNLNTMPVYDQEGKLIRIEGFIENITRRKQAEEALKNSLALYQATFESVHNGILVVDRNGAVIKTNARFAEMWVIPEDVIASGNDKMLLDYVLGQLAEPEMFVAKVKELYDQPESESYDLLNFLDGRIFERISRPMYLEGEPQGRVWSFLDVTAKRQAEDALQRSEKVVREKLHKILDTEEDIVAPDLEDIIDAPALQTMMEEFYRITRIGIGILDIHGKVLVGVGWQDICTKFHRVHPVTQENCIESDVLLSENIPEGTFKAYHCKNNLWDIMTPIIVGGKQLGNVCLGQFFFRDEIPDYELFRKQARLYGFDESEYIAALDRVPRFTHEVVDATMAFYAKLAGMISTLSYSTVKLAHVISEKDEAIRQLGESELQLKEAQATLEQKVEERTSELLRSKQLLDDTGKLARVGGWELDVKTMQATWTDMVYEIHEVGRDFNPNLQSGISFYVPESSKEISEAVRAAIDEGKSYDLVLELITAKKNRLWVRTIGQPFWDNGKITRIGGAIQDITKQQSAEEELRKHRDHLEELVFSRKMELAAQFALLQESELRFRKIFDEGSISMALLDSTFHFTHVNTAFTSFLGYTREEIVNLTFADITEPVQLQKDVEQVKMLMKGEIKVYRTEKRYLTKNRDWVWGAVQVCALTGAEGEFIAFLVMIDNITERKLIEEALKTSTEFAKNLIASMKDGVSILDQNGVHLDVNQSMCNITGFSRDELIGTDAPHPYWPPEEYEHIRNAFQSAIQGESTPVELIFMRKNGERFPVVVSPFAVTDNLGNTVSYSATVRDITKRKAKEAELLQSEERYKSLFRKNDSVMLLIEPATGQINDANPAACLFYGWSHDELCTKSIYEINAQPKEVVSDLLTMVSTESRNHYFTIHRLAKGDLRDVEVYSTPITFGNVTMLHSIIHDITERVKTEKEIHILNETLEQRVADRTRQLETINRELVFHLNEIEQFTYITSHDLQEPLRSLMNCSQLIEEVYAGKLGDEGNKCIEFIAGSASRMSELVKGLLEYSLLGKNSEKKLVDCNKIVREVLSEKSETLKESKSKIQVTDLPSLPGYEKELKLLFIQLVENAMKFRKKDIPAEVNISAQLLESEWMFSFEDNGIGIPEKDREKIFVIFKRLHNRKDYDGTGIGLAYCKKIVELHGGKIWVESKAGVGCTFYFTIPAATLNFSNFNHTNTLKPDA